MHRCIELAGLGQRAVAPNPMVGAVLVHDQRVIGEGYHQKYGEAHAEVNCLASVKVEDRQLIKDSVLYVSLEPCAHFGKTPPCADLIIRHKIPKVVIGCRDPFVQVNGKGLEKLNEAGIKTVLGVLEKECIWLNKRFFCFHIKQRPYIILKWAQSMDGKIGGVNQQRNHISNDSTNRIVHEWRSQEMGIMVGTNTAVADDPELSVRYWPGQQPLRIILDMNLRLPQSLKLFSGDQATLVFNGKKHDWKDEFSHATLNYYKLDPGQKLIPQILQALYHMQVQSVLIEGGSTLLQSFIDEGVWDEARVITNENLLIGEGTQAPQLHQQQLVQTEKISSDRIDYYYKNKSW